MAQDEKQMVKFIILDSDCIVIRVTLRIYRIWRVYLFPMITQQPHTCPFSVRMIELLSNSISFFPEYNTYRVALLNILLSMWKSIQFPPHKWIWCSVSWKIGENQISGKWWKFLSEKLQISMIICSQFSSWTKINCVLARCLFQIE